MIDNYEYIHDVEELDQILLDMQKGITPAMMNPELKRDLDHRLREHKEAMEEAGGEIQLEEGTTNLLASKIQIEKRKASKTGGITITISETQRQTLIDEMSGSIVRTDHTSSYNQNDDSLYSSIEKRAIFQRLNSLRNIYYKQEDYQNAIKIINDAIEYAITNEFPMYTEAQVRQMFADGRLKYQRPIPKLYLNYVKEITDRNILKGIVTGEINIVDTKTDTTVRKKTRKECLHPCDKPKTIHTCEMKRRLAGIREKMKLITNKKSDQYQQLLLQHETCECQGDKCENFGIKCGEMDYTIIGPRESAMLVQLHRQGQETIISPSIRMKSGIYHKYALPASNMFSAIGSEEIKINPELINFDWLQPDAGKKYYALINNKKYSTNDFINDINRSNDDQLTPLFRSSMYDFLNRLKYSSTGVDTSNEYQVGDGSYTSASLQVNQEAAKMEEDILKQMRLHNIGNS